MRVVFLTHNYLSKAGDTSGAPLGALARALLRRGLLVRIIAPADEGGEAVVDGVPVVRVRVPRSIREMVSSNERVAATLRTPLGWLSLRRLRRALRAAAHQEIAAGADLLHAHWWLPAGLAAPPGVPLVVTVYGTDAALLKRSRIARSLARPILQRATAVTAVSREVGNWVQAAAGRFVDPAHIHPMPADTRGIPMDPGRRRRGRDLPSGAGEAGRAGPRNRCYARLLRSRSAAHDRGRRPGTRLAGAASDPAGNLSPGTLRRCAVGTRGPRLSSSGPISCFSPRGVRG